MRKRKLGGLSMNLENLTELDLVYYHLCEKLLSNEAKDVSGTREVRNLSFTLNSVKDNIVSIRNLSPSYLFAEWLWYFCGHNDVEFIGSFGSMWKRLTDDGITNNSAYGYLMKHKFGFDQVKKVIELLKKDPSSRRAVINLNTPNANVIETKDEPCTIALQFLIRDEKLCCTVMMRSNDIWFGLPYDVAFFTELQKYIAKELGIEAGTYTHFDVSLHVYERNIDDLKKIVENPVSKKITFNSDKFHEFKDAIDLMVRSRIKAGDSEESLRIRLLDLAKKHFDFTMED